MGIANQLARHETAVGKGKGKGQFSVHSCFSSWFLIRMHKRKNDWNAFVLERLYHNRGNAFKNKNEKKRFL